MRARAQTHHAGALGLAELATSGRGISNSLFDNEVVGDDAGVLRVSFVGVLVVVT